MDTRLDGRTAIVTGSARRLGRAIALELAANGAAVMVTGLSDEAGARATAQEIVAAGGRAAWRLADITRPDEVERLVAETVDALGGLDILVNNADYRHQAPLEELPYEKWRSALAVMLDGPFLLARAAAPHMRAGGHGRVIGIGGAVAHRGAAGRIHAMTGKAGLVGMTRSLAHEMAAYGTANIIVPGRIEDRSDSAEASARRISLSLVPLARAGGPADIATMAAFLASDAAGYITGQTIHVNGGLYLP